MAGKAERGRAMVPATGRLVAFRLLPSPREYRDTFLVNNLMRVLIRGVQAALIAEEADLAEKKEALATATAHSQRSRNE